MIGREAERHVGPIGLGGTGETFLRNLVRIRSGHAARPCICAWTGTAERLQSEFRFDAFRDQAESPQART